MSDFTRAGDIDPGVAIPLRIGDCWVERTKLQQPAPIGRVWITDVYPFEGGEPTSVCFTDDAGKRERLSVADFRRRFHFRSR